MGICYSSQEAKVLEICNLTNLSFLFSKFRNYWLLSSCHSKKIFYNTLNIHF